MKAKVIVNLPRPNADLPKDIFTNAGVDLAVVSVRDEAELISLAKDADAFIPTITPKTSAGIIRALPKCRHIAWRGIGVESIDVDAATANGIVVTNNPHVSLEEVSDQAMALLLALARKLFPIARAVKASGGKYDDARLRQQIVRPLFRIKGQTLGLIGMGNIARTLVPKAQGFGLRIVAFDPFVTREIMSAHFGVEKVGLEDLLKQSDYVSLHMPLTPETERTLKRDHLRMMKPTSYVINTARGALIDEKALIEALQQGWIAGAGLDVTDPEPMQMDNPMLQMDNVIITGHTGSYSETTQKEGWHVPFEEVLLSLRGKFPTFAVNPKVKDKWLKTWSPLG